MDLDLIQASCSELQAFFRSPYISPHSRAYIARLFRYLRAVAEHPGRGPCTQQFIDFERFIPNLEDCVAQCLKIDNVFAIPMYRFRAILAKRALLVRGRLFPNIPIEHDVLQEYQHYVAEGGEEYMLNAEFMFGMSWEDFLLRVNTENEALTAWQHTRAVHPHIPAPPKPFDLHLALFSLMASLAGWAPHEAMARVIGSPTIFPSCGVGNFRPFGCGFERIVWNTGLARGGGLETVELVLHAVCTESWRRVFHQWHYEAHQRWLFEQQR